MPRGRPMRDVDGFKAEAQLQGCRRTGGQADALKERGRVLAEREVAEPLLW